MASSSNDPDSLVTLHFHDFRVERMRHWWTLLGEDDHADIVGFFGKFPPFMRLQVDRGLLEALASFWDPTHCCFSIGEVDLVPTMEEYAELLQLDRPFSETSVPSKNFQKWNRTPKGSSNFSNVIFAFAIKWLEKQVDPDLASKKSGWKEDDKDTSEAEPEGHSNTNATPPRPPTPPKPEGKDSQLDSKIDSLEEKIRLIQGLNSFGNTDFSSMSWFPNMTVPPKFKAPEFEKYNGRGDPMIHLQMYCRKMAPYADNEPLLIQTFQDTLTGNAAEWYSQLKKISHWKELADTFLAQYGFNSQIAPDRFDLQRMEKKSNETFREYAQRWREKAARARPPLDEREMIKIFVDTLKNPYFDRMMGLQMQFFVDLIPVGERIEDALKTKKIVDMTALMALAEQAAKKAPTKRKEGDVQMIGRNNGRPRQVLPTFTMQPILSTPAENLSYFILKYLFLFS
uniref:Uncharacterized protein n=1 Tax=Fagus sylvatica TaxID=28930 RepID=A0A2N9I506_FAGSY